MMPTPASAPLPAIFVIDDDAVMLVSCRRILEHDGYAVETFDSGAEGLARLEQVRPRMVLVDLKMPELNGLEVIARMRAIDPDLVIAVITGYATIATAVEAMKAGAYDFLAKPFTPDELRLVITRGCERWRLVRESRQLREEKAAAERRVATFLSHQLKTPLAAARQYLDVLLFTSGESLPENARAWLLRSQLRLQEMVGLIDDWLTLASVSRGGTCRPDAATELPSIVAQVVQSAAAQAERSRVAIRTEIERDLPAVRGDGTSIATVLGNLVINGVKYNRPGGEVVIRAAGHGERIEIEVSDTGIGIPESCVARIFEEFYRVGTGPARDIPGSGLGLAICRRIVDELGGSIDVQSTFGVGTAFTVVLPAAARGERAA